MAETRDARIRRAVPLLMAICFSGIRVDAKYGGGTGAPNDPYQIWSAEQLAAIGADPNDWDKHFRLMADIDLAAYAETGFTVIRHNVQLTNPPQRRQWKAFTGVLDGNDHTISNYVWPATRKDPAGLFESVAGPTGEIKNLILVDPVLSEGSYGAPLAVVIEGGTLTNCHVRGGRVSGTVEVGGLTRCNLHGRIVNCSVTARVEGYQRVGGLVGINSGTITGCHANGSVRGYTLVGGLVGHNERSILDSYAASDVNGTSYVGGLAGGSRSGDVKNCYATGNVNGIRNVGGLMGSCSIDLTECYATGNVTGELGVGGLVGEYSGTLDRCRASGNVTGNTSVGGLIGGGGSEVLSSHATGSVTGKRGVGGLIGNTSALIENCYATGSVQGVEDVGGLVGGIVGRLVNCFAGGDVTGDNRIGGLAGSTDGSITNCYATGSIHGPVEVNDVPQVAEDPCQPAMMRIIPGRGPGPVLADTYAGGLVGENYGSILNSYSSGAVLRTRGAGGLVGVNRTDYIASGHTVGSFWDMEASGQTISAGGIGKTTALMRTATTFLGWGALDSRDAWTIDDGNDYPRLSWENRPGRLIDWAYPTGEGTKEAPYQIYTPEEMILVGWFPSQWGKCFELMADVDLAVCAGPVFMIGNNLTPFTGAFEGNSHTISNFSYGTEDFYLAGLFGRVADPNAAIRHLQLIDPNVTAEKASSVGSLVAHLAQGTVLDCHVRGGNISGPSAVGGLVGRNGKATYPTDTCGLVQNCSGTSKVRGGRAVGGLVGANEAGIVTGSFSAGHIIGSLDVGGAVGHNWHGVVTNCRAAGSASGREAIGGLVGRALHTGAIENSYAAGVTRGESAIGGLVGNNQGSITNCYSYGEVFGSQTTGGLVGESFGAYASVIASFWDVASTGQPTSDGGTGLETGVLKTASTFLDAGWDFVGETDNGIEDLWWILDGADYPRLFWELP